MPTTLDFASLHTGKYNTPDGLFSPTATYLSDGFSWVRYVPLPDQLVVRSQSVDWLGEFVNVAAAPVASADNLGDMATIGGDNHRVTLDSNSGNYDWVLDETTVATVTDADKDALDLTGGTWRKQTVYYRTPENKLFLYKPRDAADIASWRALGATFDSKFEIVGSKAQDTTNYLTAIRDAATADDLAAPGEKAVRDVIDALTLRGLTDTPNDYTGLALQIMRVNAAEDAVEAVELAATLVAYDNTTATIAGAPATTQAAIDALKALIDSQPQQTYIDVVTEKDYVVDPFASQFHVSYADFDAGGDSSANMVALPVDYLRHFDGDIRITESNGTIYTVAGVSLVDGVIQRYVIETSSSNDTPALPVRVRDVSAGELPEATIGNYVRSLQLVVEDGKLKARSMSGRYGVNQLPATDIKIELVTGAKINTLAGNWGAVEMPATTQSILWSAGEDVKLGDARVARAFADGANYVFTSLSDRTTGTVFDEAEEALWTRGDAATSNTGSGLRWQAGVTYFAGDKIIETDGNTGKLHVWEADTDHTTPADGDFEGDKFTIGAPVGAVTYPVQNENRITGPNGFADANIPTVWKAVDIAQGIDQRVAEQHVIRDFNGFGTTYGTTRTRYATSLITHQIFEATVSEVSSNDDPSVNTAQWKLYDAGRSEAHISRRIIELFSVAKVSMGQYGTGGKIMYALDPTDGRMYEATVATVVLTTFPSVTPDNWKLANSAFVPIPDNILFSPDAPNDADPNVLTWIHKTGLWPTYNRALVTDPFVQSGTMFEAATGIGYEGAVNVVNFGGQYISQAGTPIAYGTVFGWRGYNAIVAVGATWGRRVAIPGGRSKQKVSFTIRKTAAEQTFGVEWRDNPASHGRYALINTATGELTIVNSGGKSDSAITPTVTARVTDYGGYWKLEAEGEFHGNNDASEQNFIFPVIAGKGWVDTGPFIATTEAIELGDASFESENFGEVKALGDFETDDYHYNGKKIWRTRISVNTATTGGGVSHDNGQAFFADDLISVEAYLKLANEFHVPVNYNNLTNYFTVRKLNASHVGIETNMTNVGFYIEAFYTKK